MVPSLFLETILGQLPEELFTLVSYYARPCISNERICETNNLADCVAAHAECDAARNCDYCREAGADYYDPGAPADNVCESCVNNGCGSIDLMDNRGCAFCSSNGVTGCALCYVLTMRLVQHSSSTTMFDVLHWQNLNDLSRDFCMVTDYQVCLNCLLNPTFTRLEFNSRITVVVENPAATEESAEII